MNKNEADRLRDIANTLDDQYKYFDNDRTNKQTQWFHWASQEIRKVIFYSGFNAFNDSKYDITTTTHKFDKEE